MHITPNHELPSFFHFRKAVASLRDGRQDPDISRRVGRWRGPGFDQLIEKHGNNVVEAQLWQAEELPFTQEHPQPMRVVLGRAKNRMALPKGKACLGDQVGEMRVDCNVRRENLLHPAGAPTRT
jgi:hypothetical protein